MGHDGSPYDGNHRWGEAPAHFPVYRMSNDWHTRPAPPDFRTVEPIYVGVIGGRKFPKDPVWWWMEENIDRYKHVVVTGDARGADAHAYDYCRAYGVVCEVIPADQLWSHYGHGAGMVRNPIVARRSDIVVAFPDSESRGTYDTTKFAEQLGKKVIWPAGGSGQPDVFQALKKFDL